MSFPIIKTREEAAQLHYSVCAGNRQGVPYDPQRCVVEVSDSSSLIFRQCRHKNGHGPDNLYCVRHNKKIGTIRQMELMFPSLVNN